MFEEYVKKSREELRQAFGAVGIKEDCTNHVMHNGKHECKVCCPHHSYNKSEMQCEVGVCYFYNTGKDARNG